MGLLVLVGLSGQEVLVGLVGLIAFSFKTLSSKIWQNPENYVETLDLDGNVYKF